ncbi:MAG TPA: bifunctional hydroxymethylpyrimidine kinase/phosphomethylpyrimidine kinase [Kofleriaceae bacterium]|nr:bifunctional hydroxymethylpyrimidine kinase/phosphomethylpyrimidine kinase [Kofleriaceae bacterium]
MQPSTASFLIISGLDPSGGAGFLADARVVAGEGLRPVGVVSALTEQTTMGVRAVHSPGAELLAAQLGALLADVEVVAGKIGLLADEACAAAIADPLALTGAPIVWDPVLFAGGGGTPLYHGDVARAFDILADHVALVTPNLVEAEALVGSVVDSIPAMRRAAEAIAGRGVACLVTGGHLEGERLVDVLCAPGERPIELARERVADGENVHGTGCALSTFIACRLARGDSLAEACAAGGAFVGARLAHPVRAGRGHPAIV